jgi:5-methyltetrahydrofolate--homocysteine methyltransferase
MGEALLKYGIYQEEEGKRAKASATPPTDKALRLESAKREAKTPETQLKANHGDPMIQSIRDAVNQLKKDEIEGLIRSALAANLDPMLIINDGLIRAMDEVGKNFAANKIFVPEMMVSAMTMKTGLDMLKPLLKAGGSFSRGRVMIATVKGDLHDIGKNIVSMMLEGAGFEVIDLGINVDEAVLLKRLREAKPHILGLSALLTTTMPEMERVVNLLSSEGLRDSVKVLVGGAPLNAKFAEEIGADGYGADAASAVDLCKRMMT